MNIYGALCDGAALMRSASSYIQSVARKRLMQDASPAGKGSSMLCVTTSDGSYPAGGPCVLAVLTQECDAADTEGAAATYTPDPDAKFYAVFLPSAVPPQGSEVLVHSVGGRWVIDV